MLDIICINNDSIYALNKQIFIKKHVSSYGQEILKEANLQNAICTMYLQECEFEKAMGALPNSTGFNLAALLCKITQYMAYFDSSIRTFGEYLTMIDGSGGIGKFTYWDMHVLSSPVIKRLKTNGFEVERWSKWSEDFDPL